MSSRPFLLWQSLFAVALAVLVAAQTAGGASVPRALPRPTELQDFQDVEAPGDVRAKLEGSQFLESLQGLDALDGWHEDGAALDIFVPSYIWGIPGVLSQQSAGQESLSPSQRISLPTLPSILPHFNTSCSCAQWKCACCARVEIAPLHKNKTGCASLSYIKDRLAVVLQLSVNNRTLIERELISGSNPPPFCFPIPQLPVITVCLRFSNISLTEDAKVQACASVELSLVFMPPLIRLRFGCLRVGHGGIAWSSTPVAHLFNTTAFSEAETAIQQFAAALTVPENEQFITLQSILRQQGSSEQPQRVQPARSRKMAWPNIRQGIPRNTYN